ncbi:Acyl carrier protein [Kitasatospora sp. MMS16-BH015]|uniref:acyl carrier protein n=1 Tax=Kitasatospora sp. MMS16-BH015 TaxID=2018025 RepID=UPI000CA0A7A7|nr:acyl carrier protein [Kitasatospora sp. MMS16-BH015]AUG75255.1 Acyl carrier protein [Kitasatospora sp. MMS16-BH015]
MTEEMIHEGLTAILQEVAGTDPAEVELDKSFVNDLDVDSLLLVEIVVAAEERFGVSISEDDLKENSTVGDLVRSIQGVLAGV